MFQTKVLDKIKTNFIFKFFFKSPRLWDNVEKCLESNRPQIILRMRIAYGMPKATITHSEYIILIDFPLYQRSHEHVSLLRYTYIACPVNGHRGISFRGRKSGMGLQLTTHHHLVPTLRMSGAIPLLPLIIRDVGT